MSWEATSWARRQRLGNSGAKLLLVMLANIADRDGVVAYVDADYLAESCEASRRTVFRLLARFERIGLFAREEVRIERSGAHTKAGRLALSREFCVERMAREDHSEADADAEPRVKMAPGAECQNGAPPGTECQSSVTDRVPLLSLPSIDQLDSKSEITTTTLSGRPAGASAENADRGDEEVSEDRGSEDREADWKAFFAAYPFDATMGVAEARRAFDALSLKDRRRAIRFAAVYAADLKRRRRDQSIGAAKWLADRRFDEAEQVAAKQNPGAGGKPKVWVARGTRAWDAWVAHHRAAGRVWSLVTTQGVETGWWFDSLFPPGVADTGPPAGAKARS